MAQTSSIYNAPLSGNLGNMTYKNYGGKQVVTTRFRTTSAKGEGASRAQRMNRMLLPNLTIIASRIRDWLPAFWEETKQYSRPYNAFIAANMHRDIPVLSKSYIAAKKCCALKLQVSQGSLPTIRSVYVNFQKTYFDIKVSETTSVDNKSWGTISQQIIDLNPSFKDGDSLAFVRVRHEPLGMGYASDPLASTFEISGLILDVHSTETLRNSWKGTRFPLYVYPNSPYGNTISPSNGFGDEWAIVHVSRLRGKYLCSSQNLVFTHGDNENYEYMISYEYISECAASWGYKDKVL